MRLIFKQTKEVKMYYLFVYNLSPDAPMDADEEIKELAKFNNMSDAVDYGAATRLMFDVFFENRLIYSNAVNKRQRKILNV